MRPAHLLRLLCVFGVCLALSSAVNTRRLDAILQSVDESDSGSLNERVALPLVSFLEVETDARVRECEQAANPSIFPAAATAFLELPSEDDILAEFRGQRPISDDSHMSHRFRADGEAEPGPEADPEAVGVPETDPALVGDLMLTDDASSAPVDEQGPDSGLKEIPPVSVLVSRYDPNLKRLVPQMPSKMNPPPPVDPRSFYKPLDNPRMGLTCCKGMPCPYANGVCCSNATFCCPHMSECVETRNSQPTCVEIPPQPALKQKIVKIEVINKDGTRIAAASGDNLDGPGILTANDIVRAQTAAFEQENRLRLHEQMLKRHQEQAKKIIQATEVDQMKADEEVAKLTARKDSAVDSIVKMIKTAADNMDIADKKAAAINNTVNMGKGNRASRGGDVDLPAVPSPEQLAEFGMPWPPMAAIINDGLGGIFVRQKGTDWTGKGLIRNGTFNVVTSIEDCKNQCEALPECRVIKFVENTMQCWLDSEMAKTPSACPLVNGEHACVSYVKKVQRWDKNYQYGVTSAKDDDFIIYDQQNRLGQGDPKNGGRLLRNGRRNIVDNLTACIKQCAELKYCVSMVYFRPNGECWLSSAEGEGKAARCARRAGRRDCISYIKKKTNPERGTTGVPIKDNGRTKTVSIENHGDVQSSTFSINLPV